jgi:hypothetical protein
MKTKQFDFKIPFNFTGALEYCDGMEAFDDCRIIHFKNEEYHRENGPAIERWNGTKEWCLEGDYFVDARSHEFEVWKLRKGYKISKEKKVSI